MESDYIVMDQYGKKSIVKAKSPRQAVEKLCYDIFGVTNPKLFKIYIDSKDKTYHTGYGYKDSWFCVGKIEWLENEVK